MLTTFTIALAILNVLTFAYTFAIDAVTQSKIKAYRVKPVEIPVIILGGPGILLYLGIQLLIDGVFNLIGRMMK